MSKRLLSLLISLGLMVMLGAASASADEIDFGYSALGSVDISCSVGGPCSLSLNPSTGTGVGSTTVGSANFVTNGGNTIVLGTYGFTGGPSSIANLETSNGGLTFTASGSWLFSFADQNGDSITNATATWDHFNNVGTLGYNQGTLILTGGTCVDGNSEFSSLFCSDFANGATIDVTLENMPTDLATLYSEGQSATGVKIETGSITPTPVPEPGSLALFGSGLLGIASFLRRKINKF